MNAEQKFLFTGVCLCVFCLCVVLTLVLVALWPLRQTVAIAVLALFLLVHMMGQFNEQALRHRRVRYREELPLGPHGEPLYLYQDMRPYPGSTNSSQEELLYHMASRQAPQQGGPRYE